MGRTMLRALVWLLICSWAPTAIEANGSTPQTRNDFFDFPSDCKAMESFVYGQKYSYMYEGTVENHQENNTNGVLIRCKVEIKVPYECGASATFKDCAVFEGTALSNGSLVYKTEAPTSNKVGKMMQRYSVYFHFHHGQIIRLFSDRDERTDILNMKRGLLSTLQLDIVALKNARLNVPKEFAETNIFGIGKVKAFVRTTSSGSPKNVWVERNTKKLRNPWTSEDYGHIHTAYDNTGLARMANELIVDALSKYISSETVQKCSYTLERGRIMEEVVCLEEKPFGYHRNFPSYMETFIKSWTKNNEISKTKIKMNIKKVDESKMLRDDQLTPVENSRIKKVYKMEGVMAESHWEETSKGEFSQFDAAALIKTILLQPTEKQLPEKFAKLSRYMSTLPTRDIEALWWSVASSLEDHRLEKAAVVWVRLLDSCSSSAHWCHMPICNESTSCQKVLRNFVSAHASESLSKSVRNGILKALSDVADPSADIVNSALEICRATPSPTSVLTLGKVLFRHLMIDEDHRRHQTDDEAAVRHLHGHLNSDCTVQQNVEKHRTMMLAAMRSISSLPSHRVDVAKIQRCLANRNTPKQVALEAMRVMKKQQIGQNTEIRRTIRTILHDDVRPIELRIACYLQLITNQPSREEIEGFAAIGISVDKPRALKYFINEHVKTQVQFRNTTYSTLDEQTVSKIMRVLRSRRWIRDINLNRRTSPMHEKEYNYFQPWFIPYLSRELDCFMNTRFVFSQKSFIPLAVNVTMGVEIDNKNITIGEVHVDLTKMLAVLGPLFGKDGILPNREMTELLKLPLSQLVASFEDKMPPMDVTELEKLDRIQDEGLMAYNILTLQRRLPISVKIFNTSLRWDKIFKMPFMRDFNLMRMWQMATMLENGWNHRSIDAEQPVVAHLGTVSSIGVPHVHHFDFSYFLDMNANITAQLKSLIFYRRGAMAVTSKPVFKGTVSWANKLQLPGGASCGSGYHFSVGHVSDVNASVSIERSMVKIELSPLPRMTEVFGISSNLIKVVDGNMEIIPRKPSCPIKCLFGNCNTGTSMYFKNCYYSPIDMGLYITSDRRKHHEIVINYGNLTATVNENEVEARGIEMKAGSKSTVDSDIEPFFFVAAKYLPSLNEARLVARNGSHQPWLMRLKSDLTLASDEITLERYQAIFVITTPEGGKWMSNSFKMTKMDSVEDMFLRFLSYFSRHTASSPTYSILGDFELPIVGKLTAKGMAKADSNSNIGSTARVEIKHASVAKLIAPSICHFTITTKPVMEGDFRGFLTKATFDNIVSLFSYTDVMMQMKTTHDSTGDARLATKVEGTRRDGSPKVFYDHRMDMSRAVNTNKFFAVNVTTTSNSWQSQGDIFGVNGSHVEMNMRLLRPEIPIPYERVQYDNQTQVRIKPTDMELLPTCYYCNVSMSENLEEGVSTMIDFGRSEPKHPILKWIGNSGYAHRVLFKHMPKVCSHCHEVEIRLPYIHMSSFRSDIYGNSVFKVGAELHTDVIPYLYLPSNAIAFLEKYAIADEKIKIEFLDIERREHSKGYHNKAFGYTLGTHNFFFNATWSPSRLRYTFQDITWIANVTCNKCVPLMNFHFNASCALKYRRLPESDLAQYPSRARGNEFFAEFTYSRPDEARWITRFYNFIIFGNTKTYKVLTKFVYSNKKFSPALVHIFLPEAEKWNTTLNANLRNMAQASDDLTYDVNVTSDTCSTWLGTFRRAPINRKHLPNICTRRQQCRNSTLDLQQVSNCANFSAFYIGKDQVNPYTGDRFAKIRIDEISQGSSRYCNLTIDGRHSPLFSIHFFTAQVEMTRSKKSFALKSDIPSPTLFIPKQLETNFTYIPRSRRFSGVLITDVFNFNVSYADELAMKVVTKRQPFEMDCLWRFRSSPKYRFQMPRCAMRYTPWTAGRIFNVTTDISGTADQWNGNARVKVNADTLFLANASSGDNGVFFKMTCDSASSVPCYVTAAISKVKIIWDLRLSSTHTAGSWDRTKVITRFQSRDFSSSPLSFITHVAYPPSGKTKVALNFISPKHFNSSIDYDGKLKSMSLVGHSVYLPGLSQPCSWRCYYASTPDAEENFSAKLSYSNDTSWQGDYYKGKNVPSSPAYMPNIPQTILIYLVRFNYSVCNRGAFIEAQTTREPNDQRRLLTSNLKFAVNIWPFIYEDTLKMLTHPLLSSVFDCPMCLGEIESHFKYNVTRQNAATYFLDVVHAETIELIMNYITGPKESDDAFVLAGATQVLLGRKYKTSRPQWVLGNDFKIVPGRVTKIAAGLRAENFGRTDYSTQASYSNIAGDSLTTSVEIHSESMSVRSFVKIGQQTSRLLFRYPDKAESSYSFDVAMSGDRIEISEAKWPVAAYQWSTENVVIELLRRDGSLFGFNLPRMRLVRSCHCSLNGDCPCDFNVFASSSMETSGLVKINIRDTDSQLVNISVIPRDTLNVIAIIQLHNSMLDLNCSWIGRYSLDQCIWKDNLNMNLIVANPVTGKKIPMIDCKQSFNFDRDRATRFMVGNMTADYLLWNPWDPKQPMLSNTRMTIRPNNDRSSRVIDFRWHNGDDWVATVSWTISNDCFHTWIVNGVEICMPTYVDINYRYNTFILNCEGTMLWSQTVMQRDTNCTMMSMKSKTPWMNYKESFNYTWNEIVLGHGEIKMDLTWPMRLHTVTRQSFERIPDTEHSTASTEVTYNLESRPNMTLFLAPASSPSSPHRLTITSGDRLVMSSDVQSTGCVFESICIPKRIDVSEMDVELPLTGMIRSWPIFNNLIPESSTMFDISLKRSSATSALNCVSDTCTLRADIRLRSPEMTEDVVVTSTTTMGYELWRSETTMNRWNANMTMTFTTSTWGMSYDSYLNAPWLENRMRLVCLHPLFVSDVMMKLHTNSKLHTMLPIDIDYEWKRNEQTGNWNLKLRSFAVNMPKFLLFNVTLVIDSNLSDVRLRSELTGARFKAFNYLSSIHLTKLETVNSWQCETIFSNAFFWVQSETSLGWHIPEMNNFTVGFPDNPRGVNVRYITDSDERIVIMTYSDDYVTYRCVGHPRASEKRTMSFVCHKEQLRWSKDPAINQQIANWHMDTGYFIGYKPGAEKWFEVINSLRTFENSLLFDVEWIESNLQEVFQFSDPELRSRLAHYLKDEVHTLMQRWTQGYFQKYGNILIESGQELTVSFVGHLQQYSQYMQQILPILNSGIVSFGRKPVENGIVLQMNILSCRLCDKVLLTSEIGIEINAKKQYVATMKFLTPLSKVSFNYTTLERITPDQFVFQLGPAQFQFNLKYDADKNLMKMNMTTLMELIGDYKCVARRNNTSDMTMGCICYKMEGKILGKEVARFSVPIPSWTRLFDNTNLESVYSMIDLYSDLEMNIDFRFVSTWAQIILRNLFDDVKEIHQRGPYQLEERQLVPMTSLDMGIAKIGFSLDVGQNDLLSWGLHMEVLSDKFKDLKQVVFVHLITEDLDHPLFRVYSENTFFWINSYFTSPEVKLVNLSWSLTNNTEAVNVTSVYTGDELTELRITFFDIGYQPYICRVVSSDKITVMCSKEAAGDLHQISQARFSNENMKNPTKFVRNLMLLIPGMFQSALRPQKFKTEIRQNFGVTDEQVLDVLCEYVSKRSRDILDHLKANYDKAINRLVLQGGEVYSDSVGYKTMETFLSSDGLYDVLIGEVHVIRVIQRSFDHVLEMYWRELVKTVKKIRETAKQVEKKVELISQFKWTPSISVLPAHNVELFRFTDILFKGIYNSSYLANRILSEPRMVWSLVTDTYNEIDVMDFIHFIKHYRHPTSYNFYDPNRNHVISYDSEFYELPTMAPDSDCKYVVATDPRMKHFSLIARGDSLIITLSDIIVETADARHVYVKLRNQSRTSVTLPHETDDIICYYRGRNVYCDTKYLSFSVKYGNNGKSMRIVKIHQATQFVTGAIGAYADVKVPSKLLPNGKTARNTTDLMKSYLVSDSSMCTKLDIEITSSDFKQSNSSKQQCQEAFAPMRSVDHVYYEACLAGRAGREEIPVCWYKHALSDRLHSELYVSRQCCPEEVQLSLYLLFSLSQDSERISAKKIATEILIKSVQTNSSIQSVGIVTYGGQGEMSDTRVNILPDKSERTIRQFVRNLRMDGPSYSHISTVQALEHVGQSLKSESNAVIKNIVVVAAETPSNNCGMSDMHNCITMLAGDESSVFLYSGMSTQQCIDNKMDVFLNTGGVCGNRSTLVMVQALNERMDNVRQLLNKCY